MPSECSKVAEVLYEHPGPKVMSRDMKFSTEKFENILEKVQNIELRQERQAALVAVGAQQAEELGAVPVLAGPVERSEALHAAEPLGELGVGGAVRGVFGGLWCSRVDRPPSDEEARNRVVVAVAGYPQGRGTIVCSMVDCSAAVEQQPRRGFVAVLAGDIQGREAGYVGLINKSTSIEQKPHRGFVSVLAGHGQGRGTVFPGLIDCSTLIEQQPRRGVVSVLAGDEQGRGAVFHGLIDCSAAIEQHPRRGFVFVLAGDV